MEEIKDKLIKVIMDKIHELLLKDLGTVTMINQTSGEIRELDLSYTDEIINLMDLAKLIKNF